MIIWRLPTRGITEAIRPYIYTVYPLDLPSDLTSLNSILIFIHSLIMPYTYTHIVVDIHDQIGVIKVRPTSVTNTPGSYTYPRS